MPLEWNHSPFAFVSGSFHGPCLRRTTPEQERYAIFGSESRLSHILGACGDVSLFTDHKNLLYMLSSTRFNESFAHYVFHETKSLALLLFEFNFTVEHIPGEFDLWKDIPTL